MHLSFVRISDSRWVNLNHIEDILDESTESVTKVVLYFANPTEDRIYGCSCEAYHGYATSILSLIAELELKCPVFLNRPG